MNIFVIHTYDITVILEFHMLNMQLSRFFKNTNRKKIAYKVEKIPLSRLQIDEILNYFHLQVNDALKCTYMLLTLTHYIRDISNY